MYCSQCGKRLSDVAAFCGQCGAKTVPPANIKKKRVWLLLSFFCWFLLIAFAFAELGYLASIGDETAAIPIGLHIYTVICIGLLICAIVALKKKRKSISIGKEKPKGSKCPQLQEPFKDTETMPHNGEATENGASQFVPVELVHEVPVTDDKAPEKQRVEEKIEEPSREEVLRRFVLHAKKLKNSTKEFGYVADDFIVAVSYLSEQPGHEIPHEYLTHIVGSQYATGYVLRDLKKIGLISQKNTLRFQELSWTDEDIGLSPPAERMPERMEWR